MQFCLQQGHRRGVGTILVAGLMLALWFGTVALACSPQLHQRLHSDSKSVNHECSVTLLTKSHLLAGGSATFVLALIPLFFGIFFATDSLYFLSLDYRLSPSRAPPAFCSSLVVED